MCEGEFFDATVSEKSLVDGFHAFVKFLEHDASDKSGNSATDCRDGQRHYFPGALKANGASIPGIGEAVPGALFTMPSIAAPTPAIPPPKKLEP